jgi:hypothetical protein
VSCAHQPGAAFACPPGARIPRARARAAAAASAAHAASGDEAADHRHMEPLQGLLGRVARQPQRGGGGWGDARAPEGSKGHSPVPACPAAAAALRAELDALQRSQAALGLAGAAARCRQRPRRFDPCACAPFAAHSVRRAEPASALRSHHDVYERLATQTRTMQHAELAHGLSSSGNTRRCP